MPEEYLRMDELEQRMRVSSWKIKQLRRDEGLPYCRWGAGTIRYPWGEIEKWIAERSN